MKFTFALLALTGTALAHNVVTHFHINGTPDKSCVRQATNTNPITDIQSDAMACNTIKSTASTKCIVKAGDAIGFEWRTDPNIAPADYPLKDGTTPVGVTDDSHKGPCAIYMKKVTDASNADGVGDGWFKVSEDGLDSNGVFCTDRIREANAPQPGVVPANIEPGDYLLRAEMLTLNNAGPASMGGEEQPQFYIGCVQVTVEGASGTNPDTVSIPGYLTMSSPGLIFDIWNSRDGKYSNYTVPGPAPLSNGSPVSSSKPSSTTAVATTKPATTAIATSVKPTSVTSIKPTSTNNPTTAIPTTISTRTRTRGPYAIETATTIITVTATTSSFTPEQTSDEETSDAEPTYGHGGRHRGGHGSSRRRYRAHRAAV